jgi:hypothetical protein
LRQQGEQYTAETGCSTPTIQDIPHSGQLDVTPAVTASVLTRARRIRRQCRDRHADEQNTAEVPKFGINGSPHPRHSRGPVPSSSTATSRSRGALPPPMQPPYGLSTQTGTNFWAFDVEPGEQGAGGIAVLDADEGDEQVAQELVLVNDHSRWPADDIGWGYRSSDDQTSPPSASTSTSLPSSPSTAR